jgi:hypothetical protein
VAEFGKNTDVNSSLFLDGRNEMIKSKKSLKNIEKSPDLEIHGVNKFIFIPLFLFDLIIYI